MRCVSQRHERSRKSSVISGKPLVTFRKAIHKRAEIDVDLCRLANSGSSSFEQFIQCRWQRVFEPGKQCFACELFLNRDRGLLPPNSQFLALSQYQSSKRKIRVREQWLTVGTVRNITTSCSWLSTGCRTRAFTNRTSPRLRFSMNVLSAAK